MKVKDQVQFTTSEKYKGNDVLRLSFEFAISIVKYSEQLEELKKYVIAKQVLRSGASIGANIKEAQNAESKADFIYKLKIALKEADEAEYWLFLCDSIDSYPTSQELIHQLQPVSKLLNKIIGTSKRNR